MKAIETGIGNGIHLKARKLMSDWYDGEAGYAFVSTGAIVPGILPEVLAITDVEARAYLIDYINRRIQRNNIAPISDWHNLAW